MGRFDKRSAAETPKEKVLEVDASMQGTLTFKDSVNLKINGTFEGTLDTKGNLFVGENAKVRANIKGESITIAGQVEGDIIAEKELKLIAPSRVIGNVKTARLSVEAGSLLEGSCKMLSDERESSRKNSMTQKELARYLEVDESLILEWANSGRLPAERNNNSLSFDKLKIDEWVASGKVK